MKFRLYALLPLLAGALFLTGCDEETVVNASSPATPETEPLWRIDYDAALKQAAAENKYVLVSISGLDWCHWCIRLEEEVFSKPEFTSYARENLVPVLLDFNSYGEASAKEFSTQHEQLLERFGVQGFPTVLILNPQGKAIVRDGYRPGGGDAYVKFIQGVIAADQAQ